MTARPFDVIAFDLGNVLSIVNERPAARALAQMSGAHENEVLERVFGPERKAPMETGRETWSEFTAAAASALNIDLAESELLQLYQSVLSPNEPIFPLVEQLAPAYRIALCSNTSRVHWEHERQRLPIAPLLDPVILSYEVGALKPATAIFQALASAAGAQPDRILFIDDMGQNVSGARAASLSAIQFTGVAPLRRELAALRVLSHPPPGR